MELFLICWTFYYFRFSLFLTDAAVNIFIANRTPPSQSDFLRAYFSKTDDRVRNGL